MAITPGGRVGDASPLGAGKRRVLDDYVREVAHALMRKGYSKSHAIAVAKNSLKRWASGRGKVRPQVRAGAAAHLAVQKGLDHSHSVTDLAVLASSQDGPRVTMAGVTCPPSLVKAELARRRKSKKRKAISLAIEVRAADLDLSVIDLVGPKGYRHGWIYEGGPGLPARKARRSNPFGHGRDSSEGGRSTAGKRLNTRNERAHGQRFIRERDAQLGPQYASATKPRTGSRGSLSDNQGALVRTNSQTGRKTAYPAQVRQAARTELARRRAQGGEFGRPGPAGSPTARLRPKKAAPPSIEDQAKGLTDAQLKKHAGNTGLTHTARNAAHRELVSRGFDKVGTGRYRKPEAIRAAIEERHRRDREAGLIRNIPAQGNHGPDAGSSVVGANGDTKRRHAAILSSQAHEASGGAGRGEVKNQRAAALHQDAAKAFRAAGMESHAQAHDQAAALHAGRASKASGASLARHQRKNPVTSTQAEQQRQAAELTAKVKAEQAKRQSTGSRSLEQLRNQLTVKQFGEVATGKANHGVTVKEQGLIQKHWREQAPGRSGGTVAGGKPAVGDNLTNEQVARAARFNPYAPTRVPGTPGGGPRGDGAGPGGRDIAGEIADLAKQRGALASRMHANSRAVSNGSEQARASQQQWARESARLKRQIDKLRKERGDR